MIYPSELDRMLRAMEDDEEDRQRSRRGEPIECHHRYPDGRSALVNRGYDRKECASGTCAICGEFLEQ